MLASGGGAIVNVSSVNGLAAAEQGMPYAVAKHGILGLTKTAAVEYARAGVRVNAVAPGLVDTPLTARMWDVIESDEREGAERELLASIPAGRRPPPLRWPRGSPGFAWTRRHTTLVIDGGVLVRG